MTSHELFGEGKLTEAIAAATAKVKQAPSDAGARGYLCELLCFEGAFDRADQQLDTVAKLAPAAMLGVNLFRQLLRAEQARQQFYSEGRLPEFLDKPDRVMQLHLEASIRLREGQKQQAVDLLRQAEEERAHVSGTCNGQKFDDLRDLDDLISSFFEALTSTGKYYWVPIQQIESVEFRPAASPRDLLWRPTRMLVRGGTDGEVYVPALYVGAHTETDIGLRLGRATDWRGGSDEPMRGAGLRTFLVGEDSLPIMEIRELSFTA